MKGTNARFLTRTGQGIPSEKRITVRKVLVTGGAGFIGANFVRYWAERYPDDRIVVLDALTYAGNRENLTGLESFDAFRFVHGDIGDQPLVESLLKEEGLETIVHLVVQEGCDYHRRLTSVVNEYGFQVLEIVDELPHIRYQCRFEV